MKHPTPESFLQDVSNHQMQITSCNGLVRNIRFKKPNSSDQYFDITTWPGHLCVSGDMGCYVFQRLPDMFSFFRNNELGINPGYWEEKVQAASVFGSGVKAYDPDRAANAVQEWYDDWFACIEENEVDEEVLADLTREIKNLKVSADDEFEFVTAVRDWDHESGFDLDDFWEVTTESYTYHFIWCCYAIVWAIQQFDAHVEALEAA